MGKFKIGIIGLGAVGERLLKQFIEHPQTDVAHISDVNESRLQEMKNKLPEVEATVDYKQLLDKQELDLVYVAVPPKFHHQIVLDVIRAGKPVFCEKPLANSLAEAKEMMEAANEAGVINAINFPLPYSQPVQVLGEKLKEGYIGKLQRIELKMHFPKWPRAWQQNPWIGGREQGGFIREITPHYIQVLLDLFGGVKKVNTYIDYPEDTALCEKGVIARMELENGVPILINGLSDIGQTEEISFRVYGDEGVLALNNWSVLTGTNRLLSDTVELERESSGPGLIDELVKALNGEPAHLVTFTEGFAVQEVLEQLLGQVD